MPVLKLTLPVLPGKVEAWRRFCQEMSASRREAYKASRQRLGITQERFELVETGSGTAVLVTIVAEDLGHMLTMMAAAESSFDRWFKENLSELHGLILTNTANQQPKVNPAVPIFTWSSAEKNGNPANSETREANDESNARKNSHRLNCDWCGAGRSYHRLLSQAARTGFSHSGWQPASR